MARGDVGFVRDWSAQELLSTQQKLCHDLLSITVGADPRFFAAPDLVPGHSLTVLTRWSQALSAQQRTIDHPLNTGLLLESLVSRAQSALAGVALPRH
jgi:DNA polymerase-3 subunit delta'